MDQEIEVMVSGYPGSVASLVAEQVMLASDMKLTTHVLGGESVGNGRFFDVSNRQSVICIPPIEHEKVLRQYPNAIVVDYTTPDAIERNSRLYTETGHSFVMGTTGDQTQARLLFRGHEPPPISAVIDVNMAAPLVLLKAIFEIAGEVFPGSLEGYKIHIKESHQKTKKDVSGTARSFAEIFGELGASLSRYGIQSIRERGDGHGYHWFTLISPDRSVEIELNTRIDGRQVYALGTLAAIRFLNEQIKNGTRGRVYDMIDVLSAKRED